MKKKQKVTKDRGAVAEESKKTYFAPIKQEVVITFDRMKGKRNEKKSCVTEGEGNCLNTFFFNLIRPLLSDVLANYKCKKGNE